MSCFSNTCSHFLNMFGMHPRQVRLFSCPAACTAFSRACVLTTVPPPDACFRWSRCISTLRGLNLLLSASRRVSQSKLHAQSKSAPSYPATPQAQLHPTSKNSVEAQLSVSASFFLAGAVFQVAVSDTSTLRYPSLLNARY